MKRKSTGFLGEKLAKDFLRKRGYSILETNYRCHEGEIDMVTCQRDCLVFIEVRTKSNLEFGTPEESITPLKIRHLERAAQHYRQSHGKLPVSWRIDLVAIELDENSKPKRIEQIENAIEG